MMRWIAIALLVSVVRSSPVAANPAGENPHGKLRWDCQACHTPRSWHDLRDTLAFSHGETGFALIGAHGKARCASCHRDLHFARVETDCASCHTDAHRGQLGAECQSCHTSNDWTDRHDLFAQHAQAGFALVGVHAIAECDACHRSQLPREFAGTSTECSGCHGTDFEATINPSHVSAGFSRECESCHGRAVVTWAQATYDHPAPFPLSGGHAGVACNTCHATEYAGTSSACASCHRLDFSTAKDPNHVTAGFPDDCSRCHTTTAWTPATLDHDLTRFPLTGAHVSVACNSCHASGYTGTSSACFACHEKDYRQAPDPNHLTAKFSTECVSCHSTTGWSPASFDHTVTGFSLTGAHATVTCNKCHASGFTGTLSACFACHETDYTSAADPKHIAAGFATECAQCHTTSGWHPANLNHDLTRFPLTGAHKAVTCENCHSAGFTGTPSACYACHRDEFTNTPDPNHVTAGFSTVCSDCHATRGWKPANLDHNLTGFPLTGAHAAVACNSCHRTGYTGTKSACAACHENDYVTAADPNHISAGFPNDCALCHTTAGWKPANLDHDLTRLPLTGAHVSVTCANCHKSGYTGTSSACYACHESDYTGAPDPKHVTAGFSTECAQCHTTAGWKPATLDHNLTRFPLTGAHVSVTCASCHKSGYTGTSSACFACHESDYTGAPDPKHVTAGFSTECTQCHTTAAWKPANLNHNLTRFPLTGAHVSVACANCHKSGYTGTVSACVACHQADYTGVADPNHVTAGFSTTCTPCHTTSGWKPATLDHNITRFPLTGAHLAVACNSCHVTGFTGTSSACYACHQHDYTGVADPNHASAGFSTVCTPCHTTLGWKPASLDHNITRFPLTGAHLAVACNSCHVTGFTGTSSACYACHQHDYTGVADPNHVSAGFSTVCTPCHTTSGWIPATLDHNTTRFPLTGAHLAVSCNQCHVSGYTGTSTACAACHQTAANGVHDPDHSGLPSDCSQCHTTSGWKPATFNHNLTRFALTGAHQHVSCGQCHTNGYSGTPMQCDACHHTDYLGVTDPNHTSAGFSTDCVSCHTTSGWKPASFDHGQTGFALTGAHRSITCNSCHASGFTGTASACYACHHTDYAGAANPNHTSGNYPTLCEQCHTTSAWAPASYDHTLSGFPLTGAHISVACTKCHTSGFAGTPTTCYACHATDYTGVTDPNHVAAGFATTCQSCHSTTAWTPASFDHSQSGFPLTGAHTALSCNRCHANGYTGTPMECLACHGPDYAGATPDHAAAGFPTTCQTCHTTTAWKPANWNHDAQYFPIYSGAHREKWSNCSECHVNPASYATFECIFCHEHNQTSMDSKHQGRQGYQYLSTACYSCHPRGHS